MVDLAEVLEGDRSLVPVGFSAPVRGFASNFRTSRGPNGPKGEADILVAVYDVPDTAPAVGNTSRQVIDDGAWQEWIGRTDFRVRTVPFYRDHGMAHVFGVVDSSLKIGFGDGFHEGTADVDGLPLRGLIFGAHYNLAIQAGADCFEQLRFDPLGTEFSFRWDQDRVYRGADGFEHVSWFHEMVEVSQVGFGAQALTGPLVGTVRSMVEEAVRDRVVIGGGMRGPIGSHSTATTDEAWDGAANERRLPSDATAATLRREYAWVDPDKDAATKAAYKGPHHMVDADGAVGAANIRACSAIIAALNGGRGGFDIPDGDRRGTYNHAAKHIRDGGGSPADLRSADDDGEGGERHKYHGDDVPKKPSKSLMQTWLKDPDFREMVSGLLGGSKAAEMLVPLNDPPGDAGGMRAFSVDRFRGDVSMAFEAAWGSSYPTWGPEAAGEYPMAGPDRWCFVIEAFVEDFTFARGWVVAAQFGTGEGITFWRVPWASTGDPDADGLPDGYEFDFTAAIEVEQAWQPVGTPTRAALEEIAAREGEHAEPLGALLRGAVLSDVDALDLDWYDRMFSRPAPA